MKTIIVSAINALILLIFVSVSQADDGNSFIQFDDITSPCNGHCSVSVFSGIYSKSGLGRTVATTNDLFDSRWGDGGVVGAMVSRRLIGVGDYFQIEGELGAAQRFGNQHSPEVWAAFYARWLKFPWNDTIETTFAVSTGLNYAFGNDPVEVARLGNGGSPTKLLHYFSPEITFALPSNPQRQLFIRFHHRSGMGQTAPAISNALFNDAAAGSDYLATGMRWKF